MRFLHTSDWHIGKLLHGARLLDDQCHALDQLLAMAKDLKPDFLLVAGDIYDKAIPPQEAVEALGDFLCRLVLDAKVPALMLAGNHDSGPRLGFAARLFAAQGVHIVGNLRGALAPVTLEDRHGKVDIHLLPYAEPADVRELLPGAEPRGHQEAMAALLGSLRREPGRRAVLAAHAFVAGGEESDSERPLSIGGSGVVDAALFGGYAYDYVALGHLHRPQRIGPGEVHYPGSLGKYSFSERDHRKGVNLVEMDAAGACKVERIPFTPRRDLRRIEGTLDDLLRPATREGREDWLEAVLLDEGPLLQPMERLRQTYPNILHIERPYLSRAGAVGARSLESQRRMTDADLFGAFFGQVAGRPLTDPERTAFARGVAGGDPEEGEPAAGGPEAEASPEHPAPAPRLKAASGTEDA